MVHCHAKRLQPAKIMTLRLISKTSQPISCAEAINCKPPNKKTLITGGPSYRDSIVRVAAKKKKKKRIIRNDAKSEQQRYHLVAHQTPAAHVTQVPFHTNAVEQETLNTPEKKHRRCIEHCIEACLFFSCLVPLMRIFSVHLARPCSVRTCRVPRSKTCHHNLQPSTNTVYLASPQPPWPPQQGLKKRYQ